MIKNAKTYKLAANNSLILHVDGDAFFAECERAQFPRLKGKPIVVGEERGIACALSYEAKALGVTRGMPIFKIKELYRDQIIILPSHFELYEMYSQKMQSVLSRFTSEVESYSIDECFAVLSYSEAEKHGGWEPYLGYIKEVMQKDVGITFSFGLAQTKVLAKIASKYRKPDGATFIAPCTERSYLEKTPIGKVWGIGYRSAPKLILKGIRTAYDFASLNKAYVDKHYSKPFVELWYEMNGTRIFHITSHKDDMPKSLQSTRTFTPKTRNKERVFSELSKNIEIACMRLRRFHASTDRVSVYLKTSEFRYAGTEITLSSCTIDPSDILKEVEKIFDALYVEGTYYRATGVTLWNITPQKSVTLGLFARGETKAKEMLLGSVDTIRQKYGSNIIYLGGSMRAILQRQEAALTRKVKDAFIYSLPFPYLGEVV